MTDRPTGDPGTVPSSADLADWLARNVPASREHIAALREEIPASAPEEDRAALLGNPYTLLSEAFFWPVCVPAVESGDADEAARMAGLIERLLLTPDRVLSEAVLIRVVEPLADEQAYWSVLAAHAGPNLRWAAEHH